MIDIDLQLEKQAFHLDARFSVSGSGVTAVFGPSGCGKTSLLRAIAGLEPECRGCITVNGEAWHSQAERRPVENRGVGLVFQNPSLFPHLSVEENILFGRNRLEKPGNPIEFKELITALEVGHLLSRRPGGLSGGESQRVALCRALLAEPKLLLMDEPLSALDQQSRTTLMSFLDKFLQEIDLPVLYVTHSTEEVARLADNLVLLEGGSVTDYGPLEQVLGSTHNGLSHSDTAFSVLEGQFSNEQATGLIRIDCENGVFLQVPSSDTNYPLGSRARLRIRARDVSLCLEQPQRSSILNIIPANIMELAANPTGGSRIVKLDVQGHPLLSRVSDYSIQKLGLHVGQPVYAQIKSASLL